jgi:ABC-type nitrate/sulfonate/bicarbonate transport system substrate-binding protein
MNCLPRCYKSRFKLAGHSTRLAPPADARAAFDKGAIDAWSIWEPYLSTTELKGHAKSLIDGR